MKCYTVTLEHYKRVDTVSAAMTAASCLDKGFPFNQGRSWCSVTWTHT